MASGPNANESEPALRIFTGTAGEVETLINRYWNTYGVTLWDFREIAGELRVSAIAVHEREIRKAAIASATHGMPGRS